MKGPGCPSMAEYHELRQRRRNADVEEMDPEPAREHLDLGGGAWLTVRAGLSPVRRELLREAARELVAAVLANPDLLDGGRRGD